MDRASGIFVDGMGAAAATSGVLSQLQGRIFGLLYLQPGAMSLDEITTELGQSKSNVSVAIRGLSDWQLVRLVPVAGSRKDHYEAATDFWRVVQEILERRYRWNLRQVLATTEETKRALGPPPSGGKDAENDAFLRARLDAVEMFFGAMDAGVSAMSQGETFAPGSVRQVLTPPDDRG
ncbi:MAG: hypothetical protein QOE92_958 [Chloroflexota bacterium]|jgi:DNA-binding transcriptional regulator GbsR (MarR family)|nr:hypothetical protein [Chloroflexota bacterium]